MDKKEASILIVALVAFIMMAVHYFVCINRGSVLFPRNIAIQILFVVVCLGGCLCVSRKYRHINWKHITFLSASVVLLLVLRYVLLMPVVIEYLGFTKYMIYRLIYIATQLVLGIVFFVLAKPKVSKEKTA